MARRAPESLADYLAVAGCPALIMLLVGSLVFFLIEVFYQGQYEGRLLFVMAMFVMAIVAIARISIEQDVGFATLYAIPLAGVVLLAMSYFVKIEGPLASVSMLVNACFMGIVWWSAHKLTWDCTLIDDMQDASGQGLLQGMGLDLAENAQASAPPATAAAPGMSARADDLEAVTQKPEPERPWFERWLANDRRPHAPGVWIIYFSLAALPLFGFGGWFVPGGDAVARGRVFQLLVVYVASGLGLLLATSFLGLRRYLRQRKLEMPLEMTATWTALGLALILVTLLTAAILPRPHAEYSLTQLPVVFTSAVRHASRMAMRHEGTEDKSNERAAKAEAREGQQAQEGATKREGESGEPGEPSKSGKAGSADDKRDSSGDSQKGDSHSNSQASRGGKKTDEAKGGKSKGSKSGKPDSERGNEAKGKATEDSSPADPQTESSEPRSPEFAKSESPQPQAESTSQPNSSVSQLASTVMQGVVVLFRWLF